jgi:hypothetical protein
VGRIDREYLQSLIEKTEEIISRKIRVLVLNKQEFEKLKDTLKIGKTLPVWTDGKYILEK